MDPIHLLTSELDYELDIRGIYNLGTARQKTNCLREFMTREANGERTISRSSVSQLDVSNEISVCSNILGDISDIMQQASFVASARLDCRSRLLHIVERIKRIKPVSEEDQAAAYQLIEDAEAQLLLFQQPTAEASRPRRSSTSAKASSPLADVIERIQEGRQRNSISSNSIDRTVQENQAVPQRPRRSLLNPAVPEFVPLEGAVGGTNDSQLPLFFDHPPPAYSSGEPRQVLPLIQFNNTRNAFRSNQPPPPQGAAKVLPRNAFRDNNSYQQDSSHFRHNNVFSDNRFVNQDVHNNHPRSHINAMQSRQVDLQQHTLPFRHRNTGHYSQGGVFQEADNLGSRPTGREYHDAHQDEPVLRPSSVVSVNERDFDFEYQQPYQRQNRKSVPINQWKISYSGDGHGLHLHDFLAELKLFQRSEGVTDDELFSSIVHLLTGRARLWYRSWFDTFRNWNEMVAAMKIEYLPPKYDFKLLTNISNRRQKISESFAEYLTTMQSLFNHLSMPITEQHKLCIVEENILPKYAIATSVLDIATLDQLSKVCRRVDCAYAKSPVAMPIERGTDQRPGFRNAQFQNRPRAVHLVDTMQQLPNEINNFPGLGISADGDQVGLQEQDNYDQLQAGEVMEMRRNRNHGNNDNFQQERRECYNCRRVGHSFSACPAPRNGQFCFRCGSRDVTSFNCRNCAKNGVPDSEAQASAPNPQSQ